MSIDDEPVCVEHHRRNCPTCFGPRPVPPPPPPPPPPPNDDPCPIELDLRAWDEPPAILGQLEDHPFSEGFRTAKVQLEKAIQSGQTFAEDLARLNAQKCNEAAIQEIRSRHQADSQRLQHAITYARYLLHPANVEDGFWLLSQTVKRSVDATVGEAMAEGIPWRRTDCEAMSVLFTALGQAVDWDLQQFVAVAGHVLSGEVSGLHGLIELAPPGKRHAIRFGESGFKPEFVDVRDSSGQPSNQVRHFVGYFILGLYRGGLISIVGLFGNVDAVAAAVDEAVARERELPKEPGDYRLGVAAASFGERVASDPSLLRTIGDFVKSDICTLVLRAQPVARGR